MAFRRRYAWIPTSEGWMQNSYDGENFFTHMIFIVFLHGGDVLRADRE